MWTMSALFLSGVTLAYSYTFSRMLIFWTVATWVILAVAVSAIRCPQMCNCSVDSASLTVDCAGHRMNEYELTAVLSETGENLRQLNLYRTGVTHVPRSVCRLSKLEWLRLDDNRLTGFPDNCFISMTSLSGLHARRNQITRLQDGVFHGLRSLTTLKLDGNRIADIGLRVFSNRSNLLQLRDIGLSNNLIRSLEPWPYIRGLQGSRDSQVIIDLSNNLISNFSNRVGWPFTCNDHSYFRLNVSRNNIGHLTDIVDGWNVKPISHLFCIFRVKSFGGRPNSDVAIDFSRSREYRCDCEDIEFYKFQKRLITASSKYYYGFLERLQCSSPVRLANKLVLEVPLEQFVCELSDRCPSNCRCVYRPANATLHIYCSGANLSSLPLDLPPLPKSYDRYKLDFSDNRLLQRLEHRPYFVNTSLLDVSNCGLTEISLKVWKDVALMKTVNFRGNFVQTLPRRATTINISASLLLGGNPWKCSCDNSWMIGFLRSLSDHVSDPGDIICQSPSRMHGRNVLKSTEEEFCVDPVKRALTIALSTVGSACVVLILTPVLIYKLRVRLYKTLKIHLFDRDECLGEDMLFDVFLCCSSEDYDPHGRTVLQLLESENYRVCSHYRDFQAGLIVDNIDRAVTRSKRTLCLLSNNFLQR